MNFPDEDESCDRKKPQNKTAWLPIFLCWLAYTAAYLGRYSYASNITAVMDTFHVNHADAGFVTTCFFFAYGIGQIMNGIICRHYNKRVMISFALAVSAILNFIVFLGVPFCYMKYLWLLNGIVQSILWPTLIGTLSENLESRDLTKAVVIMSTTVPIGTFLTYGISAVCTLFDRYSYSFLAGTIVMATVAVVWLWCSNKAFRSEESKPNAAKPLKVQHRANIDLVSMIVVLAIFAIANNLVKDGLTTWVPSILKENFGLSDSLSILLTLVLPILGFFGAALNAIMMRKIKSFLSLSCLWYLVTAICIGAVLIFVNTRFWVLVIVAFGLISLFMHGVNNIITSMAPLYLREKINSGFLAGFLNGCCYAGSTISSYEIGRIADVFGWNRVFFLFMIVCLCPVVISIAIGWVGRYRKQAPVGK